MSDRPDRPLPDSPPLAAPDLDKPYLGTFSVVEFILRETLNSVVEMRRRQLLGEPVDVKQTLTDAAARLQRIMYGQDPNYAAAYWNRPEALGKALVEVAEMGGDPADAVERLAGRLLNDFIDFYLTYEAEKIDDEKFGMGTDWFIDFYTRLLLGLPEEEV